MPDNEKSFNLNMTITDAFAVHPRVPEVFAQFHVHLGGCAHCQAAQVETLGEVCQVYGLDGAKLIEALEGVLEQPAEA